MNLTEKLSQSMGISHFGGRPDAYMRILAWEGTMSRRKGVSRLERCRRSFEYYNGDNMPPGQYIQPLAINYVKLAAETHASYLWGEWEPQGRMVTWTVKPRRTKGDKELQSKIEDWIYDQFEGSQELLYAAGLNQSISGDAILKPRWDALHETTVPESILPEYFHCRWSAHDVSVLEEVVISYHITRDEAEKEFGTRGDGAYAAAVQGFAGAYAIYWEYWTPEIKQIWIDNLMVVEEKNPFALGDLPGVLPFVHIPNIRAGGEFYGNSDIEAVLELQDEINRKLADQGDVIAYNAHPIIKVTNYFGKVADLPMGPDSVWDLGREGDADFLKGGGSLPVDAEAYIDRLIATFQDLVNLPPAALGRDENAASSALAMSLLMGPVTKRVGWKRLHWKLGLENYVHLAARLAETMGQLPFPRSELNKYRIEANFAPILPKDRAVAVMENVSLVSSGIRSTPRALEDLGERNITAEMEAIYLDIQKKAALGMELNLGGKNARGPGGSPDTGTTAKEFANIGNVTDSD